MLLVVGILLDLVSAFLGVSETFVDFLDLFSGGSDDFVGFWELKNYSKANNMKVPRIRRGNRKEKPLSIDLKDFPLSYLYL